MLCANLGDCRTILDGVPLSTDHKPFLPQERKRILEADGIVMFNRVDGELDMSRALGDFELKGYNQSHIVEGSMDMEEKRTLAQKLKVSSFPEVTVHYRTAMDQIVILACDGVWDVMSDTDCNEKVRDACEIGKSDVGLIAEKILHSCFWVHESYDNMTILIGLLPSPEIEVDSEGRVRKRRKEEPYA